jgi:hypothetical protein
MKSTIALFLLLPAMQAMGDPGIRCSDALCLNFQEIVPLNHQHLHRCADSACLNFQQYVPRNHRHLHRNSDVKSPDFLEYVPQRPPRRR